MNKFFGLAICFLLASPTYANDTIQTENVVSNQEAVEELNIHPDSSVVAEINSQEEAKPIETVTHTIEKEVVSMPSCDDKKLVVKTKEFIEKYLSKVTNQNVTFRRRRHFILKGLDEYTKENIANYKTEKARPVSDLIVKLKINNNIIEENMLLCKNTNTNDTVGNIYLLVHPQDDGYRVFVVNMDKSKTVESVYFDYK